MGFDNNRQLKIGKYNATIDMLVGYWTYIVSMQITEDVSNTW